MNHRNGKKTKIYSYIAIIPKVVELVYSPNNDQTLDQNLYH